MARRSPSNPRYQKGASIGKTRRSAASAKPTRGAGADSKKASTRKKRRSILAPVPSNPEFRRWRKIWLGALGAAIVFSGFAWWQQGTWPGTAVLILAYACIFTAFYIDFRKMRPLRKAAIEAEKAEKNGSSK
ncbi:MAG: hypothetical protein KGZ40_05785 [Clostridiales bacterium]|nr:hypothetical protein [Clostridiales bacterium]